MGRVKREGWYAKKTFPHFDLPLGFEPARELVSDPASIVHHSFKPFIGYTDRKRRFKPKTTQKYDVKERPIKYCSHRDGYIHSYYASQLVAAYEKFLQSKPWNKCVIGYRAGLGTNIHMAKNAFNEIRTRKDCCALAIDISDFFGSIEHDVLLENLKRVLGQERLSQDWFKVYRSMTRYAWVESEDLVEKLGFDPKFPPRPLCDSETFRNLRAADPEFVKPNSSTHGIPQGSPISAIFSNVYMIDFDATCFEFITSIGGFYRRYSDDIFVVCDKENRQDVEKFVAKEIEKLGVAIKIKPEKTEVSYFSQSSSGALVCDAPISYLGFTYDGVRTLLRARTMSRYFRRMTFATRHTARAARKMKAAHVFKRKLYRQFTHLGRSNFYSYAKRASEIFEDRTPKRQLRRHVPILHRKLKRRGK